MNKNDYPQKHNFAKAVVYARKISKPIRTSGSSADNQQMVTVKTGHIIIEEPLYFSR